MKPILTFYIVCVFEVLMTLGNLVGFMTYIYQKLRLALSQNQQLRFLTLQIVGVVQSYFMMGCRSRTSGSQWMGLSEIEGSIWSLICQVYLTGLSKASQSYGLAFMVMCPYVLMYQSRCVMNRLQESICILVGLLFSMYLSMRSHILLYSIPLYLAGGMKGAGNRAYVLSMKVTVLLQNYEGSQLYYSFLLILRG